MLTRLLHRWPLRRKLALVGLLSATMLVIPTAFFVGELRDRIAQARAEQAGLGPAGELLELTRLTAQHRGLSNGALNGNPAAEQQRRQVQAALEARLAPAESALASLGDESLAAALAGLVKRLRHVTDAVAQRKLPAAESFAQHTRLIEDQIALLYDTTVATGLVLHPAEPGYFLQDTAFNHLPWVTELLGRLRGSGMGLLARGSATPQERAALAVLLERTRIAAGAAQRALVRAAAASPRVQEALGALPDETRRGLVEGLDFIDAKVIGAAALDHPGADWWARTTALIDAQYRLAEATRAALAADLQDNTAGLWRHLALSGAAILVLGATAAFLLWAIAHHSADTLQQAMVLAEQVAAGELAASAGPVPPGSRDEAVRLLQALGAMAGQLADVVGAVRANATQVATASVQIAQGNRDMAARTESQASTLQQTAAAMEELRATVGQNAGHAREADQLAHGAREVATRGGAAVGSLAATMGRIRESSHRIADIVGTIDGIAFQTNILALNASVEAARAGEQGRGFAVVAAEVRALAQRSAEAAREIRRLIADSVERVEQGSEEGERAAATVQEIVASIGRVSDLMADISAASAEQHSGVAQVSEAIARIDHVTQQNAALVEQGTAAADSLRQQAQELQHTVERFHVA